jgi:5-oxopent-3-ene-1,2,5-tricarboxylate decarboxylase/2-hydroxyhepta-2,4-diene-1,7-dioate isomerase
MAHTMLPIAPGAASGVVFGVALNYRGQLDAWLPRFDKPPYQKPPQTPVLFIKTPNTVSADGAVIPLPAGLAALQPGPALGLVMGRRAHRLSAAEALDAVAGYVVANEVSLAEDTFYRPAIQAKCRDGFCPLGAMVPSAQVGNPHGLAIRVYVDGELKQQNNTANLITRIPELLEFMTSFMTLEAGDVVLTGVPEGRVDVAAGQTVTIEIERVGRLQNMVQQEQA